MLPINSPSHLCRIEIYCTQMHFDKKCLVNSFIFNVGSNSQNDADRKKFTEFQWANKSSPDNNVSKCIIVYFSFRWCERLREHKTQIFRYKKNLGQIDANVILIFAKTDFFLLFDFLPKLIFLLFVILKIRRVHMIIYPKLVLKERSVLWSSSGNQEH